uniref:Uncharacterized protein n=1 Tax=Caenorhabditis japonica TaxID=281687 RepID=A0A8R1EDL5_CAEJA
NGTYTSVPNVVNFALKIIWGITIDKAKERKYVSGTFAVKLSQSIANFGGALFLILIANFVDCTNPSTGFLFFCLMYGCMGTLVSGFYTSLLSLAPKYTATMSSISVFCAMLGRLLTPAVVGLIKKDDTLAEWQTLFLCCAAANLICGTVFLVFGSGELQEWGLEDPSDEPRPLEMEKTPLQSVQNIPESEDGDVFQSALDMEIPEIQINEITLTTEERERFKRRIREDSMSLRIDNENIYLITN